MSSHIASLIAAVWSLIRIGKIPGESNNSKSVPNRTHFSSLVTPGLGAAGHILRFSKRLIKDDLPTFGYPTIPARTGRGSSPFSFRFVFTTDATDLAILPNFIVPMPSCPLEKTTLVP
uniref:Uncharacterized protein n=1 Tax=Arundo donax TaxID=35708 RepID=A0A0A9DQS4_ARUDO